MTVRSHFEDVNQLIFKGQISSEARRAGRGMSSPIGMQNIENTTFLANFCTEIKNSPLPPYWSSIEFGLQLKLKIQLKLNLNPKTGPISDENLFLSSAKFGTEIGPSLGEDLLFGILDPRNSSSPHCRFLATRLGQISKNKHKTGKAKFAYPSKPVFIRWGSWKLIKSYFIRKKNYPEVKAIVNRFEED